MKLIVTVGILEIKATRNQKTIKKKQKKKTAETEVKDESHDHSYFFCFIQFARLPSNPSITTLSSAGCSPRKPPSSPVVSSPKWAGNGTCKNSTFLIQQIRAHENDGFRCFEL